MDRSWRVGQIGGIPIAIHFSWPFIVVAITGSLAMSHLAREYADWPALAVWAAAAGASLLLFLAVLAHELAHAFVAKRFGVGVESIDLLLFGGVTRLDRDLDSPVAEFTVAAAGPVASLALAALSSGCLFLVGPGFARTPVGVIIGYVALMNLALGLVNLIPGLPLDGGRMLRAALGIFGHSRRQATRLATLVGEGIGWVLVAWGLAGGLWAWFGREPIEGTISSLWLVITGWFLIEAARRMFRVVWPEEALARLQLGDLSELAPAPCLAADATIETIEQAGLLSQPGAYYPVVDGNTMTGVVTVEQLLAPPRDLWAVTTVGSVADPINAGQLAHPGDRVADTLKRMGQDGLNRLIVVDGGRVIGVITRRQLSAVVGHVLQTTREPRG